jgi:hypothetical protein
MQNFPVSIMSAGHAIGGALAMAEALVIGTLTPDALASVLTLAAVGAAALAAGELVGVEGGFDEGGSHESSTPAIAPITATTRRGAERVMETECEP